MPSQMLHISNIYFNKVLLVLFLLCLTAISPATAQPTCPMMRIVTERLPDMTMPRCGHGVFYANGELTVTGGHTTHFVPVATAEYYADGEWHQLPMAYPHDNGFAVVLHSGEVLVGGGHAEELGVGQTYTLERYNPTAHTFEGFGCLDRRRVLANATVIGQRVIISGNHYAADAIACYNGRSQVEHLKAVRQGHCNPYILPIGDDDALILSGNDVYNRLPDTVWVDRVKGDAFRVPLLEQWRPVFTDQPFSSESCMIGKDAYLLDVVSADGQMGLVVVSDTTFSLLPTACPIPMQSPFGPIFYKGPVVIDKVRQQGYVIGVDSLCRHQFVLAIDYAKTPASRTLFHTDSIDHAAVAIPIVTPDGDLILAGGSPDNNYKPLSTVWLYHFGTALEGQTAGQTAHSGGFPIWIWMLLVVLLLAFLAYFIYIWHKRKHVVASILDSGDHQPTDEELMELICQVIERDRQYLTSRLRLSDIAVELGVNVTALAECIDRQRHCTFAQLIAEYRVHHVQQLLSKHPDMKLSAVIAESGFTSESTFFRSFKAVTGLSPKEWLAQRTS